MRRKLAMLMALTMCASLAAVPATAFASEGNAISLISQNDDSIMDESSINNDYTRDYLTYASDDPNGLDPFNINQNGKQVIWFMYEALYAIEGRGGDMYPVLADATKGEYEGYDHEDGTSTYTVYLWDCIYDHAGNHITADDVVFSFNEKAGSGYMTDSSRYVGITAIDDYTVEIEFTDELTELGKLEDYLCNTFIFSQAAYESSGDNFANSECGTGPYTLGSYTAGANLTMEKYDDYWQKDDEFIHQMSRANVQTIEEDFVSEASQIAIGLETGSLDSGIVTHTYASNFAEGGDYSDQYGINVYSGDQTFLLFPNMSGESIASDINLRLAVYYAIDNNGIVAAMGGEDCAYASVTVGNGNYGDYADLVAALEGEENYYTVSDPAIVQEYLDASDYNGEELVVINRGGETYETILTAAQAMLLNYGINMKIITYDPASIDSIEAEADQWDFILQGWASSDYVANIYGNMFALNSNGTTANLLDDPTLQEMIDVCCNKDTHSTENLKALHDYVVENAYVKGFCSEYQVMVYPKDMVHCVKNLKGKWMYNACCYLEQ